MRNLSRLAPLIAVLAIVGCGGHSSTPIKIKVACPGYVTPYGCQAHSATFGLPPAGAHAGVSAPVPTVEMRDSVNPAAITRGAPAVACYAVGSFANCAAMRIMFAPAHVVTITPTASFVPAECLDDEPGDATPSEAAPWVLADIRAGVKVPCVYASLSNMPAIEANLAATLGAGWRVHVLLWDADWTFFLHLDAGFDCTQWTDHGPQGQNYDESTCKTSFFGAPLKPPKPKPSRKQLAHWRSALKASEHQYAHRDCALLVQRVDWFSGRLKAHPKVRRGYREGALKASRHAYANRSCAQFDQRIGYYEHKLKS